MQNEGVIEAMPNGLNLSRADKGQFLLNVWRQLDGWEVRPGFSQIAKMSSSQSGPAPDGGFRELLGSYAVETTFGTPQILALWRLEGFTANTLARSSNVSRYALTVYDADLRCGHDFVLHHQTSQRGDSSQPAPLWKPVYTTSRNKDRQSWQACLNSERPFFCAAGDAVLFGSGEIGVWMYLPCDPGVQGDTFVDATAPQSSHRADGEPGCLMRVVPSDGATSDGQAYFGSDAFPSPVDACRVGASVCYVSGRSVYLTDPSAYGSIRALNAVTLPTRSELVAVGEVSGSIVAMTKDETWLIRMTSSGLLDFAEIQQLDPTIGCFGPQAKTMAGHELVWCDRNGIYSFDGGTDISSVDASLEGLIYDGLSNPLSSYYNDTGDTLLANRQPNSFIRWDDDAMHLTYDPSNAALFICLPTYQSALCMTRGSWSLWTTDTQANDTPGAVVSSNNLLNPHMACASGRVFMVAGPELYAGTPVSGSAYDDGAAVFCELGAGGGIDRNSNPEFDGRVLVGYYKQFGSALNEGALVVGKPKLLKTGEKIGVTLATRDTLLFPVYLHPPAGVDSVDIVDIQLSIDSQWDFVTTALGASTIDVVFPSERDKARDGWGYQAPAAGAEIRSYNAGVPAAGGKDLVARFDGNYVGIVETWSNQPWLIAAAEGKTPLFWLPLLPPQDDSSTTWSGFTAASIQDQAAVTHNLVTFVWEAGWIYERDDFSKTSQPVDWALSTGYFVGASFGSDDPLSMARLRGAVLGVLSHGDGATIAANSKFGLMNAVFGSDWREFSGQITDYLMGNKVIERSTVRARLEGMTGSQSKNLFDGGVAKWGSEGTSDGNVLIGDEQLETLNISGSVKGEGAQMMLFGHVRGVAQRLFVRSVQLVGHAAGKARRIGR